MFEKVPCYAPKQAEWVHQRNGEKVWVCPIINETGEITRFSSALNPHCTWNTEGRHCSTTHYDIICPYVGDGYELVEGKAWQCDGRADWWEGSKWLSGYFPASYGQIYRRPKPVLERTHRTVSGGGVLQPGTWLATDSDGRVFQYTNKPRLELGIEWVRCGGGEFRQLGWGPVREQMSKLKPEDSLTLVTE